MVYFSVGTSASCHQGVFFTFQKKSLVTAHTYCISEVDFPQRAIQTSVIVLHRPPKPYKLLIFFYDFCDIPTNGQTQ